MIKALIFDLDGVIVDTAKYHFSAWKNLASSIDIYFTEEHNENLKGVSRAESLDYILSLGNIQKSKDEKEALMFSKNANYLNLISKMEGDEILPGVENFILNAKSKGYKIALGSASKNAKLILEKLNLDALFDARIDGTKFTMSKPNPEVFLMGASELGVLPKECIVFEDSKAGIQAAKSGGMKSIGIGDIQELSEADIIIESFENINLDILDEVNKHD